MFSKIGQSYDQEHDVILLTLQIVLELTTGKIKLY